MSARLWVRLCDKDREVYGGDEWYSLDVEELMDSPAKKLARLEKAMDGYSITSMLTELSDDRARAKRAFAFLARREAGLLLMWDDFDPRTIRMQFTEDDPNAKPEDDATPLDSGESQESSENSQATKPSRKRSGTSGRT